MKIEGLIEDCIDEFFKKNSSSIINEGESRIQHLEDLVLFNGTNGAKRALEVISSLYKEGNKNTTIKWDGSPAVVFGRDDSGSFIFTDKHGFVAKGYDGKSKTGEELENMLLNRGKTSPEEKPESFKVFASKMRQIFPIFESAVPKDFIGFFKGDLLYMDTPELIDGRYIFKPNVVKYEVKESSNLGKKIKNSLSGVVIHSVSDKNGNESEFSNYEMFDSQKSLAVFPSIFINKPPKININKFKELSELIKKNLSSINNIIDNPIWRKMNISDFSQILYTYINKKVDIGLHNLGSDFIEWLESSKVSKSKQEKIKKFLEDSSNKSSFNLLWEIVSKIMNLKDEIIDELDKNSESMDVTFNTTDLSTGESFKSGEGYVYKDSKGMVKLVSRSKFSKINRSIIREGGWLDPKLTSKTKLTPEVVGKVDELLKKLILELNVYLNLNFLPIIENYEILGSAKYYKEDIKDNEDVTYGDIDVMLSIPSPTDEIDSESKIKSTYFKNILDFIENSDQDYIDIPSAQRSKGSQIIVNIGGNDWVQIDLLLTLSSYKEWFVARFSPQRGLKGFVIGSLYSSLAEMLSISISDRGVRVKLKDGKIVPFILKKDTIEKIISKNPTTFLYDILIFISEIFKLEIKQNDIDSMLKLYKGIEPNDINLKTFSKGVLGLIRTLDNIGFLKLIDTNIEEFILRLKFIYKNKLIKQLSDREKKVNSPETLKSIEKIKKHSDVGWDVVNSILEQYIYEGGNVFKGSDKVSLTKRIDKSDVFPTVEWLEYITDLPLMDNMLGTTGKKSSSGDIDLAVDSQKISKDELVKMLVIWCNSHELNPKEFIKKSGESVHFKTPIKGSFNNGFVQTDFMFGDPEWMKFSMQGGLEGSPYRGEHRHILLASIARFKGYKWSFKNGLVNPETNEIISKNPDEISKILLGDDSNKNDMNTVESILNKIKKYKDYEQMVKTAKETLVKYNVEL